MELTKEQKKRIRAKIEAQQAKDKAVKRKIKADILTESPGSTASKLRQRRERNRTIMDLIK